MLGLAAVAALAVMAFAVASASADVPCTVSSHTGSCSGAGGTAYTGNILGLDTGTALLLEGTSVKETCKSTVLGLAGTNEGNHVGYKSLVDVGELDFFECSGLCENATNLRPAWLLVEALTLDAWVTEDGAGKPRAELFNCLFGAHCVYEFTNATQLLKIETRVLKNEKGEVIGEDPLIVASSVPLTKISGIGCPSSNLSFDAKWLLEKDEAGGAKLFVAALT